jgi:ABC-2 type transport system ATP-binding protein
MHGIVFQSVSKVFRHRPALFNFLGRERTETTVALRDVSLTVRSGCVLALLGPNGSGKTTLLKLISTMLLPDAGRVLVHGCDTRSESQCVRSCVGFAVAGERSFFPRLTARENLDFFAALDDVGSKSRKARIAMALERTGLLDASDTLAMKFSAGMYQKLAIARALIKQPAVLLLDEPTCSLDPAATADIWNLVRELSAGGATIVIATHNFQEAAAVADSVAVFRHGEVAGYREIPCTKPQELQSFYFETTADPAVNDLECLAASCQ